MRVLITGAAGMLGSASTQRWRAGHEVVATDLAPREVAGLSMSTLDVRDFDELVRMVNASRAEIVLHLAAETDLEICESNPDRAYLTNTLGTQNAAIACQMVGSARLYRPSRSVRRQRMTGHMTNSMPRTRSTSTADPSTKVNSW